MLRSERTAFEVASFLVGKVSGGSIEKVVKPTVKGACSPMLLRRRMENRPRYSGDWQLGRPFGRLVLAVEQRFGSLSEPVEDGEMIRADQDGVLG